MTLESLLNNSKDDNDHGSDGDSSSTLDWRKRPAPTSALDQGSRKSRLADNQFAHHKRSGHLFNRNPAKHIQPRVKQQTSFCCEENKEREEPEAPGRFPLPKQATPPKKLFKNYTRRRWSAVKLSDGTDMKFCPGAKCGLFLPLFQFSLNSRMLDGFDTYCKQCNQNYGKRSTPAHQVPSQGQLAMWRSGEGLKASPMPVMKREILERLRAAVAEAEETYQTTVPFDASSIFGKLFSSNRLVCEITGEPLTPSCFMEHHGIRVVVDKNEGRADVKCSHCRVEGQ